MTTEPPPPRYKIVERAGRLVTIDTWAKPGEARQPPSSVGRAKRGGIASALVAAVLRIKDERGRRLLTTGPGWDGKGPRVIALSADGERRLGGLMLAAIVVVVGAIVAVIYDFAVIVPIVAVAAALATARSDARTRRITAFLDRLGEELPR